VPGMKSRLAAGVAVAGACALLAACSSVQLGAAAIVGNQRITQSSLDNEVSNLQQNVTRYGLTSQVKAADMPKDVLTWLVRFRVTDRAARDAGITVSQEEIQRTLNAFDAQEQQAIRSQGAAYPGLTQLLVLNGLPPDQETTFGRWLAEENALVKNANGGKLPTTQAEATTTTQHLNLASCKAAKALNIRVNPQYGQLSYQVDPNSGQGIYAVMAQADGLSRPSGQASSAPPTSAPQPC